MIAFGLSILSSTATVPMSRSPFIPGVAASALFTLYFDNTTTPGRHPLFLLRGPLAVF